MSSILRRIAPGPRCQRGDVLGAHSPLERVRGRVAEGLGVRSGLLRLLGHRPAPRAWTGEPSRFAEGDWVRVLDAAAIERTLDARSRTRGLAFIPQQRSTCGQVYRVQGQVRRMLDDHGRYRPIHRTVLLEATSCAGDGPQPAGCGRRCPLMYRDEWLEPAPTPAHPPRPPTTGTTMRVRPAEEIVRGLDLLGRRGGVTFMPEMARWSGRRFPVVELVRTVFEYDRSVPARAPVYVLAGLHCTGAAAGASGPCDRACSLLWHADWLVPDDVPQRSEP